MSKNKWYLNRFKNANPDPGSKKGPLRKPPYHVHPELEDELKKQKDDYTKKHNSLHWNLMAPKNPSGLINTLKKSHEDEVKRLDGRASAIRRDTDAANNKAANLEKKLKALDDRVKALETP